MLCIGSIQAASAQADKKRTKVRFSFVTSNRCRLFSLVFTTNSMQTAILAVVWQSKRIGTEIAKQRVKSVRASATESAPNTDSKVNL